MDPDKSFEALLQTRKTLGKIIGARKILHELQLLEAQRQTSMVEILKGIDSDFRLKFPGASLDSKMERLIRHIIKWVYSENWKRVAGLSSQRLTIT